jgi:hypothetical protein
MVSNVSSYAMRTRSHLLHLCSHIFLSVHKDDTMDEKNLAKPDHAQAVNLARRFTTQNENDLMRKCVCVLCA